MVTALSPGDPAPGWRLARLVGLHHAAVGAGDGAPTGGGEEEEGGPLQGPATCPTAQVSQPPRQRLNLL